VYEPVITGVTVTRHAEADFKGCSRFDNESGQRHQPSELNAEAHYDHGAKVVDVVDYQSVTIQRTRN